MADALGRVKWELLEAVLKLEDERQTAAQSIWASIRQAFQADELAIALGPVLSDAESRAVRLLADIPKPKPAPKPHKDGGSGGGGETPTPIRGKTAYACLNSDEAEIAAFYRSNPSALERNRLLVRQLKQLYGASQVCGDSLPNGLPADKVREALEVHHIKPLSDGGADERSNMIVVSATLHALIHADSNCVIDLARKSMTLFGVTLELTVAPDHNG